METKKSAPAARLGALTRTVTKILRFRRAATDSGVRNEGNDNQKLKSNLAEYQSGFIDSLISTDGKAKVKPQLEEPGSTSSSSSCRNELDMESLLANIFAGVSAIKAAYAQLQVAESPYDPDTIQASDQAVVSELKHLSNLKQSYLKKQQLEAMSPVDSQLLSPQLQEQRNLLKTYQITNRKLESILQHKDAEIKFLQAQLLDSARFNRSLESKLRLRPRRTLSLENLHQSLPDPKHFISVLRLAVKSVRTFVKQMVREMEYAGWDLETAAGVIQPVVRGKSEHWTHAFESFVCRCIFSDFQHRDFGISLDGRSSLDRRRFFQEFLELSSGKLVEAKGAELGKFIRTKYLSLVHPKMEASFFGDLSRRAAISSGRGFPDSEEFFAVFAEMAKRVWLLHRLYFSYAPEVEAAIFQVKRGCRFSEVYMESVTSSPVNFPATSPSGLPVAFTVAPGFRVGKTLIQCKVYVSEEGKLNGRSR
ncbi:protein GRAVITROPIC IN THE LIGHT 1 [Dendrobium catenatum]|uniref:Uncharacterized protein n=1 Tax=Dendrobium catenatum TaxID=906689 RepID=A0A2I0WUD4_9ASPA|nr:protein GRAVITROPIC IN THE LIGHT 1 [Dendrobium catenatum]XP_028551065.1 protein GRAVITROPIC IN THE LIGHT 1 [Dendrobium catenatum]PKU79274.1 hypothetical protein MA16_Dca000619 [Dendrobium catenatum]